MKYMLLIYGDPNAPGEDGVFEEYMKFTQDIVNSGEMVAGDPLQGIETATTVRVRDGKRTTTDGPFAETKEVLGGYYIVDLADLDAALAWAAKVPNAPYGSVEVRPVVEFDAP